MKTSDFDFVLPADLIARHPAENRTGSRLLHVRSDDMEDLRFTDLPQRIAPDDLLILNDTRVLRARLLGRKESGGRIEALIERISSVQEAIVQLRASKPPAPGTRLRLGSSDATVLDRAGEFWRLRFDEPVFEVLERDGAIPLPPYIDRTPVPLDDERYQTVFAQDPGSVAAPTAGLHFDAALLQDLRTRGVEIAFVTLHVGAGTFQPVRTEELSQHRMHFERYRIPEDTARAIARARASSAAVIAVGTTTLRTLEAAADDSGLVRPGDGETDLFITPGYRFRIVDRLLTNFHLPRSTLLMLVSAFAGCQRIRDAYAHAIRQDYRFFSYGDAMLLQREDEQ